jgi:3-oxoacyl-[acyl-carrier-protein] synthase II
MRRRVVITGLGPVSSIGIGMRQFREAIQAGMSGIAPITSFDTTGFPYTSASEVQGFDAASVVRHIRPEEWGRSSLFSAAAARLAFEDAGLADDGVDPALAAAVIGTTSGESQVAEALTARVLASGFESVPAGLLAQLPAERLANAVSAELGLDGESITISTACSASNYAVGYAYDLVSTGEADVALAGGADSVCRWAHAGFYRLGALAEKACTPFDRDRSGIVTGEGGAVVALEAAERAQRRGARPYAEVLGYGLNCDASHMVAPNMESIAACMRLAHRNAGIVPGDVDYVSAHGTGTPANDSVEAQALLEVFGDRVPPVSSIKSMLGHTMGAASGFGLIASSLAIAHGFMPPTINYKTADPAIPWIDPVPNQARDAKVTIVQNDGFAFGGNNAIVVLGAAR